MAEGMCADVAVHDTDGHNPHAHILLTVRPLTETGAWQYKTEKEYLCVKGGEERGFTAAEFKSAQAEGWEKQYQYKVDKKKVYMAPSQAEKWNGQEKRTPKLLYQATCLRFCVHRKRLTSGGRLSSLAVLRRRRL